MGLPVPSSDTAICPSSTATETSVGCSAVIGEVGLSASMGSRKILVAHVVIGLVVAGQPALQLGMRVFPA